MKSLILAILLSFAWTARAQEVIVALRHPAASANFSLVQLSSASAVSGTSVAAAFSSNVVAGHLLVASAVIAGNSATLTCSDTEGNAYTTAATEGIYGSNGTIGLCYAIAGSSAADTITTAWSASNWVTSTIIEYAGPTGTVDQTNSAQAHSTSISTGNVTTTVAKELLLSVAAAYTATTPSWTVTSPWVNEDTESAGSAHMITADRIVSSTGTYSNTFGGAGASTPLAALIVTFH